MFEQWSIKRLLQLWSLITLVSIVLISGVAIYTNQVLSDNQSVLTQKVLTIQQAINRMTTHALGLIIRQKQMLSSESSDQLDTLVSRSQLEHSFLTQLQQIQSLTEPADQGTLESLQRQFQQFLAIDTQLFNIVSVQHQISRQLSERIKRVSEIEQNIQQNVDAISGRIHLNDVLSRLEQDHQANKKGMRYSESQRVDFVQLSQTIQLQALTIRYLTQLLLHTHNLDELRDIRENQLRQHEQMLRKTITKLQNKLKQQDKPLYQIAVQLSVSERQLLQEVLKKKQAIYELKQQQIHNNQALLAQQQEAIDVLNAMMKTLDKIALIANTKSEKLAQHVLLLASRAKWLILIATLVIIFTMIRFVRAIAQRINQPLQEVRDAMHALSGGRFDLRLPEKEGRSEFAVLATDFNLFASKTEALIQELGQAKADIQLREQHIRAILNGVPEAILSIQEEGVIDSGNGTVESVLKVDPHTIQGLNLTQFLAPAYRSLTMDELDALTRENKEVEGINYLGQPFTMWLVLNKIDSVSGAMWVCVISDITIWKQTEAKLKETSSELNTIFENAMVGIALIKERKLQRINRKFEELFGYDRSELEGQSTRILYPSDEIYCMLGEEGYPTLAQGKSYVTEILLRRKDGSQFWGLMSGQIIDKAHPDAGSIWLFEDITQQRKNDEKLKQLATTDILTGLPNRSLFNDRLEHALYKANRSGTRVAVLFMDLDNFKHVNDSLGHSAGDLLLCEIAQRLKKSVREGDTIARLGGDEFTVILEEIRSAQNVAKVAEKILAATASSYDLEGTVVSISPSIGISLYPADGRDVDTLLKNADAAMYHAKRSGKNNFQFYSADMNAQASQRLALEAALRKAVENEEFYLHFQPQIHLESRRLSGVEVLLRWHSQEWGNMSPAEFVPILEQTGLIHEVGQWVIKQSIQTYLLLQTHLPDDFRMAVNLSGRQFLGGNLAAFVAQALQEAGMPAHSLELEITESILMEDTQLAVQTLNALSELGITLAIDDFGTGYSSLSYLKRFPLNILKIDRSFVHDITLDKDDAAIVDAILAISRRLNLKVVAEGVETQAQLDFLQEKGCDYVQGYYFSKPLPLSELTQFVTQYQSHNTYT